MALQSENFVLEKQLHSYQQALSKVTEKEKEKDIDTTLSNHVNDRYRSRDVTRSTVVTSDRPVMMSERPVMTSERPMVTSEKQIMTSDRERPERQERRSSREETLYNDRPRNESRRNSTREGRDKSYDRSSADRMSYRYR